MHENYISVRFRVFFSYSTADTEHRLSKWYVLRRFRVRFLWKMGGGLGGAGTRVAIAKYGLIGTSFHAQEA